MKSKFNSSVGSARAAKIASSDVVDINAYRKVKQSDISPGVIILSRDGCHLRGGLVVRVEGGLRLVQIDGCNL